MASYRQVMVFSAREEFCEEFRAAAESIYHVELECVGSLGRFREALGRASYDTVVVDGGGEVGALAIGSVLDELSPTPMLCVVGDAEVADVEASVVFATGTGGGEVLAELVGLGGWQPTPTAGRRDRASFEVPDSGFRRPPGTNLFTGPTSRVMYVGQREGFREGLVAEAEQRGVELLLHRSPTDVVRPRGAQSISLLAIEVGESLGPARRLIAYLRDRHPEAGTRVVLAPTGPRSLRPEVARVIGADDVLTPGAKPRELFDFVRAVKPSADRGHVLVVSTRNGLIRQVESVLVSEGMVVDVRRRASELRERVDAASPDVIIFDEASAALAAAELARGLLEARPHCRSRLVLIGEATDRGGLSRVWDARLPMPVEREDLLRMVRLLVSDLRYSREVNQVDSRVGARRVSGLVDDLASRLERAQRARETLLVVGLDAHDLHSINEGHGRDVGDSVLRALCSGLGTAVGHDRVFRHRSMCCAVATGDDRACEELRKQIVAFAEEFRRRAFRTDAGRTVYAKLSGAAVSVPPLDISAEVVLEKCWIVLQKASNSKREELLLARLDPASLVGQRT